MISQKILGIGTDITSVSRMKQILQKSYKQRFLVKTLNPIEIEQIEKKSNIDLQAQFLASRWAFKEAVVKATGRVDLVYPQMYLEKNELRTHVSISHEDEYSVAFVLIYQNIQQQNQNQS
ncbi:4'-phosphopantetheinyl transferase superfamily [Pseudocohnilembus persalinus]|uniref:4'-phosphopantetheinyl transferase superfamily n=1 Tax=Pseudocohnilembus persalinus TaxID=266149 RepID=A0A0V0R2P6_PSEPJ|nr:4'-phosphopantetheinyl transferase superfamily [Pseudocohnilembus persalinus]|eukprot:KRX08796.1 4'-phosphopantetheinyl transferase superfamily [Pseudocohnilembus persalinus]